MPGEALFLTLEGGEGVGKSTQARALARLLYRSGCPTILTREPGGTALGRRLRRLLLQKGASPSPWAELFLFAADRAQHAAEVILPALRAGQTVICERFTDSTIAYQGYGRGLDLQMVRQVCQMASYGLTPHLTVLLDMEPEAALARKPHRDRIGGEGLDFHRRVRQGFLSLAREEPQRFLVVDASLPPGEVTQLIWQRLSALLQER
ncbi:MAG: dTMP kinase [Dehalococcoidia bacterium]|jgi:dTMP kinase|nr:dTMP kinase [Dehalococcoidia bacterium]